MPYDLRFDLGLFELSNFYPQEFFNRIGGSAGTHNCEEYHLLQKLLNMQMTATLPIFL